MLRSADLLVLLSELLCHRASTLGSLHQLPVSYEATWLLPRLDFHQLAINGLLGAQTLKTGPLFGAGFLGVQLIIQLQFLRCSFCRLA